MVDTMIRDTFSFVAGFLAGAVVYKFYSDQEFDTQAKRLAQQRKRQEQAALRKQKASEGRAFEGNWQTGITYRPGAIDSGSVSRAEAIRQAAEVLGVNPII